MNWMIDQANAPEVRQKLLGKVVWFTRAVQRIPGVLQIALIGSLTTAKPDPKDVDLLVTVAEDADLTRLATLGRKLQGHAQSMNRGGEVFLVNPQGHYLGRTCPWKECGLGIRLSCDARHCGARQYLHDDLDEITLSKSVITQPPIILWPEVVTNVTLPKDVERLVIRPLTQQA